MRVMGLDVGDKTIGVAVSDPLGWTAQGLEVIRRDGDAGREMERLAALVRQYGVERIVVGLPHNMNGTLGPQGEKVLAFVKLLRSRLGLPVQTWDERLSTVAAEKLLISADVSRSRRKQVIDKMAAVIILQGFLEAAARKKN
ncbi:Holliday junction resolvase RuvX [Desulfotomaculum copahuensis]|uniref:Putative pre-16S rRNA nuclease n=1 Tax=Desulfotomaculum copahuensis TaxID=1838280 RepID=A0A1B7LEF9_9FIRM|nr:Holliday junction resolvase RuvX [Desulfotomaculum copahuensis]OAT81444.1 Holliday junction DNA helicase RuvA [Desulfotomaculum copahuensis]